MEALVQRRAVLAKEVERAAADFARVRALLAEAIICAVVFLQDGGLGASGHVPPALRPRATRAAAEWARGRCGCRAAGAGAGWAVGTAARWQPSVAT